MWHRGRVIGILMLLLCMSIARAEVQAPKASIDMLNELSPEFAKLTENILFKDIWNRPGLSARDKSLITIVVLVATNRIDQLEPYINLGLKNGLSQKEIQAAMIHIAFFIELPSELKGLKPILKSPKAAMDELKQLSPEFGKLTEEAIYKDIWSRPGLSARDKSLITIAVLVATNKPLQAQSNMKLGLYNGLTKTEIEAAIIHIAFYAGWPSAVSGLQWFKVVKDTPEEGNKTQK
jgi:4-carboxymuconolactone decarboxylase